MLLITRNTEGSPIVHIKSQIWKQVKRLDVVSSYVARLLAARLAPMSTHDATESVTPKDAHSPLLIRSTSANLVVFRSDAPLPSWVVFTLWSMLHSTWETHQRRVGGAFNPAVLALRLPTLPVRMILWCDRACEFTGVRYATLFGELALRGFTFSLLRLRCVTGDLLGAGSTPTLPFLEGVNTANHFKVAVQTAHCFRRRVLNSRLAVFLANAFNAMREQPVFAFRVWVEVVGGFRKKLLAGFAFSAVSQFSHSPIIPQVTGDMRTKFV